jgi:rhodanese-related sulfurtransferase
MVTNKKVQRMLIALFIFAFVFVSNSWAGSDLKMIDTARLHSMVVDNAYEIEGGRNRPFMVIDARTKQEYDEGYVFSAVNIPEKDFEQSIGLLPKDKGVLLVVYCDSVKSLTSRKWADKAKTAGYTNVVIYSEGFSVWKEKGMPIAPLRNGL